MWRAKDMHIFKYWLLMSQYTHSFIALHLRSEHETETNLMTSSFPLNNVSLRTYLFLLVCLSYDGAMHALDACSFYFMYRLFQYSEMCHRKHIILCAIANTVHTLTRWIFCIVGKWEKPHCTRQKHADAMKSEKSICWQTCCNSMFPSPAQLTRYATWDRGY